MGEPIKGGPLTRNGTGRRVPGRAPGPARRVARELLGPHAGEVRGPPAGRSAFHLGASTTAAALAMAGCLLFPSPTAAQDNFQIQVSGSQTVSPGSTLVELFSNVAAQGTTRTENGLLRSQGAFHETLGITQGWTAWSETGFFVLTSVQPDSGWEWAGARVQPRVRVPDGWHLPVGLSLSVQLGYARRPLATDTWTLSIGPIIDKQWGPWYVSFNPTLDLA